MASHRICVCFSDTGGGHRSAAEAVEEGILEVAGQMLPDRDISITVENMAEKSHPINQWMVELYNFLLRHCQASMKYYTWVIEATKPNNSEMGYRLARKYAIEALTRMDPSVVVSVHPMTNHYLARAMKELGMAGRVKLVIVVTDPNANLWSGWACPDADLIIAPNDLSRDRLISLGVLPERIRTVGMPINPSFLKPPAVSRKEFLTPLELDPERLTVCITAGWAGGGHMTEVYAAMDRAKRPVQAVFTCGHNTELFEYVKRASRKSSIPTAVLPFHDSTADLMSACDLLVTKAGGLTTFEAIARRLPMALDLITEAMPQESGTADILIEYGLAKPIKRAVDIVPIVEQMEPVNGHRLKPLPSAHSLDRVDAIYEIARLILSACDPAFSQALVGGARGEAEHACTLEVDTAGGENID